MICYLFVNHDVFYMQESGKLSAIEEGTEEDMNGYLGPRFVKRKGKVTFADDAHVYCSVFQSVFGTHCCFTIFFRAKNCPNLDYSRVICK